MSSTLQQAIEVLRPKKVVNRPSAMADKLLGSFKGIIPPGKSSTQFIRELRKDLYGKTNGE